MKDPSKKRGKKRKLPPCTVCSSTRYHRDDIGFYVCEYGHQSQSYQEEQSEGEGMAISGRRIKQKRKKRRKKRRRRKVVVRQRGHGVPVATFLEAAQYILREQTKALIKVAHLPKEVEKTVQDLWLMHISILWLPDILYLDTAEVTSGAETSATEASGAQTSATETSEAESSEAESSEDGTTAIGDDTIPVGDETTPVGDGSSKDQTDTTAGIDPSGSIYGDRLPPTLPMDVDDPNENDTSLPELPSTLRMNSDDENDAYVPKLPATLRMNSDDDNDGTGSSPDGKVRKEKPSNDSAGIYPDKYSGMEESGNEKAPSLPDDTSVLHRLALLYLGCFALKLPIFPSDILKWCGNGSIPYWAVETLLPPYLSTQLPSFAKALSPKYVPALFEFESAITKCIKRFRRHNKNLQWPDVNNPMFLLRLVKELSLPVELYVTASRIMQLGHTFDQIDKGKHIFMTVACPLIISIKLLYDLNDGSKESEMFVERLMHEIEDSKPIWIWTVADLDGHFHGMRKWYAQWAISAEYTAPSLALPPYMKSLKDELSLDSPISVESTPVTMATRPLRSSLLPNPDPAEDSTTVEPHTRYARYRVSDREGYLPIYLCVLIRRLSMLVGGDERSMLRMLNYYENALEKDVRLSVAKRMKK
ncbi:hypothetical protein SeMB42_g04170 [Synchytrium endobioticum]|uniref:RRN7-type domain-containing protein n=1 Tax=Synchytrium endobioticum TaxID=286115 RepID=A0A507D0C1_9FUNG|nr:hypothetical protein SeMB42_g04170 [Synchytrium endobioticum]